MATRSKDYPELPRSEIVLILRRLEAGEHQHIVAADYLVNQGRLSELKNGKRTTFKPGKHI